jgi:hypothetical protein
VEQYHNPWLAGAFHKSHRRFMIGIQVNNWHLHFQILNIWEHMR